MRIIGRIPHPNMQITVFSNDGRFPVQFEQQGLTQTYRFRHGPRLRNFAEVKKLVDEAFVSAVLQVFTSMRKQHRLVLRSQAPDPNHDALPDII